MLILAQQATIWAEWPNSCVAEEGLFHLSKHDRDPIDHGCSGHWHRCIQELHIAVPEYCSATDSNLWLPFPNRRFLLRWRVALSSQFEGLYGLLSCSGVEAICPAHNQRKLGAALRPHLGSERSHLRQRQGQADAPERRKGLPAGPLFNFKSSWLPAPNEER